MLIMYLELCFVVDEGVFDVVCQISSICTESFVPPGLGGAFVTDEAEKWIALTPSAVPCCRNTLFTAWFHSV